MMMINELYHHGIKGQKSMRDDELYHFGILGMKWGIRRFQNKDGTLTKAGKKRYDNNGDEDSFTIEKGTTTYRFANADDKNDGPKYMSVTDADRKTYQELGERGGLFYDRQKDYGEFVNELDKDIRVKRGEKVVSELIDKYGEKDVDTLRKDLENVSELAKRFEDSELRRNYLDDWDAEYFTTEMDEWGKQNASNDRLDKFITDVMNKHVDEIISDYKKQNKYDAIVDPNDWISNMADMPLIVFDPSSSVKRKSFNSYMMPWYK